MVVKVALSIFGRSGRWEDTELPYFAPTYGETFSNFHGFHMGTLPNRVQKWRSARVFPPLTASMKMKYFAKNPEVGGMPAAERANSAKHAPKTGCVSPSGEKAVIGRPSERVLELLD